MDRLAVATVLSGICLLAGTEAVPSPWDLWGQLGALGILGCGVGVMMLKVIPDMLRTNREQASEHKNGLETLAKSIDRIADNLGQLRVQCALTQASHKHGGGIHD